MSVRETGSLTPRAFFIFTEVHGLETCESSASDIRTGKRASFDGCFDPARDVYFFADATRVAIRIPFLEIEGATNDLLVVQDPKSLKFRKAFTFSEVNEKGIYRTGAIEKIEFDGEGLLHFVTIIKKKVEGTLKETEEKMKYVYHYDTGILQPLNAPLVSFENLSEKNFGKRVGDWTITSVNMGGESQRRSVQFRGEITIEGRYYKGIYGRNKGLGPCFIPDPQYVSKFPQMNFGDSSSQERIHLCFSNVNEARRMLSTDNKKIGKARIVIRDFNLIDSEGGDEIGTAVLKKVLSRSSISICDYPILKDGGEGWSWNPVDPQYQKFSALGEIFSEEKCGRIVKGKSAYAGPSRIELSTYPSSSLQKDFKKLGYYCDEKGKKDAVCTQWKWTCKAVEGKDFLTLKKHIFSFKSVASPTEWGCMEEPITMKEESPVAPKEYVWDDESTVLTYAQVKWHPIESQRFSGFSPAARLNKKITDDCISDKDFKKYLKREGGICGKGVWFEDEKGSRVDSIKKLNDRFLPVNDEQEAMSFVAFIKGSYFVTNESDILEGEMASLDDGFLVRVMEGNPFGCGSHEPRSTIYKVTKNGEVTRLAREKQKPRIEDGSPPCVD